MSETTIKQQLQQFLDGGINRENYGEIVGKIYKSFRTIDQAQDMLRQMESAVAEAPKKDAPGLREQAGIFAYALGEFHRAAELLRDVKDREEGAHFYGRGLSKLHLYDDALKAFEKGRSGDGDFQTDRFLVDVLCMLGETGRAAKICQSYKDSMADTPDWLYCMGRVAETEGEYGEAAQYYEKAISLDENHRESLFRLAYNCDLNGEDDRAVELYGKCASLQPASLGALMNLGVLYEDRSEYEKAIECYEKVLATEPAHKRARLYLKDADAALHMTVDEDKKRMQAAQRKNLEKPLDHFDLSTRCRHVLEKRNIATLGDLTLVSEAELLELKNFGESSLQEIKNLLASQGKTLKKTAPQLAETNSGDGDAMSDDPLRIKMEDTGMTDDLIQYLQDMDIVTLGDLAQYEEDELLTIYDLGDEYVAEIRETLEQHGMKLKQ